MANHPTKADYEAMDGLMYQYYLTLIAMGVSIDKAVLLTEDEFGERADWCKTQYISDPKRNIRS